MADRSITLRLGVNVKGLQAGFRTAQQSVKDFGSQTEKFVQNNRQSLEQVGQAGMVAGGLLAAGAGIAIAKFAKFDQAMANVNAATGESAENMQLLREAAIDAGADTAYSAEEAASAIEELAKAGVSTADILGGGLDGALSLAAAGAMDVGQAAELAATAMTQFSLSGEDIPHIADLLAAGAGKAQGSVEDMGSALKQAGLVADQTGLTIEETTGGLAAFASAGLVGSDAGTSFKSMLQRLTPQSKEAATKMAELGISAFDAQGEFIGLSEFAGVLENSMKDLTTEERNAAMATIFGSDAVRAASVIYENGASGVQKWEDAVNDAGFAAETAAARQDTLAGDLEKLSGSFDTVLLRAGSGANEFLRGSVQGLEGLVDTLGTIPAPILSAATAIAGISGAALVAAGGVATFLPRLVDTREAFRDLQSSSPRVAGGLRQVGRAATAATAVGIFGSALGVLVNHFTQSGIDAGAGRIAKAIAEIGQEAEAAAPRLDDLFTKRDGGDLTTEVGSLDDALTRLFKKDFLRSQVDIFQGIGKAISFGTIKTELNTLGDAFERLDSQLASTVSSGRAEDAAATFDTIKSRAESLGIGIDELNTRFPQYLDSLDAAEAESIGAASGSDVLAGGLANVGLAAAGAVPITEEMADKLKDLGISAEGAITILGNFAAALVNAGLLTLSARDAERAYEAAIDSLTSSLVENGATMDINTEQGRNNQAALDGIASAGINAMTSMASATDAFGNNIYTQDELQGRLRRTYNDLITAAQGAGYTAAEADGLARSVLGIPGEANIDTWMSDFARAKADETMGRVNALDGKTANVYINTHDTTYKTTVLSTKDNRAPLSKGPQAFATGGAVYGPGSGTSDTAGLFRLSNGEHVLTAAEVKAMGGQAAVYDFRSQLANGFPGYAGGGQVQGRQVPAMAGASTISASVDSSGVAAAVASAMSGWQPIVNIGGREFFGVMKASQRAAERP